MRLCDVGELGFIERIGRIAQDAGGGWVVRGIGDDAAVLRPRAGEDLALTTDALVEGVHFRWPTHGARSLGRRALAVNLSDLAAMGARPRCCLLALAAPPELPLRRGLGLVRGLVEEGARAACPLVGGNLTRAGETSLTVTVLGSVPVGGALRRDTARAGDRILVTGTLGGAALDVARAERLGRPRRHLPEPRLDAGQALRRLAGIGACIDVSDGLVSDLGHVLRASGVGARVELGRLPRPRGFAPSCRRLGLDPDTLVLTGGEDYELLFTLRRKGPSASSLSRRLRLPVTEIGSITRSPGLRVSQIGGPQGPRGTRMPGGWRHF